MTREEIEQMQAGTDIDTLIAEKIMGYQVQYGLIYEGYSREMASGVLPRYSNDIAAAWEVVEKMREYGYFVFVTNDNSKGKYYDASFELGSVDWNATAETAPLAICRAALIASLEAE